MNTKNNETETSPFSEIGYNVLSDDLCSGQ